MEFPFQINDLNNNSNEELKALFEGFQSGFVEVLPTKYVMPAQYRKVGREIFDLEVRPDDVWVCTYPRSGTTLMQELVWIIANNFDYETAAKHSLMARFPFVDFSCAISEKVLQMGLAGLEAVSNGEESVFPKEMEGFAKSLLPSIISSPSPRFIKTHLPFSLCPPKLVDTCKCIYVARNPKDMAVSYYHHNRLLTGIGFKGDFSQYWDIFERNILNPGPFWEHVKEGWQQRTHPNILFLFYEDIIADWPACIRKVANFLKKPVTEEQVKSLAQHMHIDNFRNNASVNLDMDTLPGMRKPDEQPFIRNGKTGSWKAEFTPELTARADKWIAENIAKIPGFSFP